MRQELEALGARSAGAPGEANLCVVNTCTVTSGQTQDATCTLKIDATDFIRLTSGDLPAMQAYTSGKLKIEGDIMKSQLIERLFTLAK